MSEVVAQGAPLGVLPRSSDFGQWDERERALAMTLGLAVEKRGGQVEVADRGTIEVFLAQCQRTQLDPVARQIYCIKRGNKWGVQISIDGARLVAERSGGYEGQTPVEWTADGMSWSQVWLSPEPPAAARVGVYRAGFREALYAVARWDSYAVYNDVWENGRRTGARALSPMWAKMPDLMLGKVAEMLALRKAFPQDLSGLYSTEEMGQAGGTAPAPVAAAPSAPVAVEAVVVEEPAFDAAAWELRVESATSVDGLKAIWDEAESVGVLGAPVLGGTSQLGTLIQVRRDQLTGGAS